jgi:hypothetical protein
MAMWVNTTDETYYKSKECANNISFGLPITDGLNFGGFIWERDTNLDFTQPLTVQLLEVLSGYLLPIIDQPIGGIFANYVVGYDNNGELYLYFRDFDYAGLTADICNFILRISDGSNYVYSKYVYNIGFGNCSCIAGDTTTIESTPISTYDCCGAYYGLPNGIEDGDSSLLASNLMEIYGKIRTAPSSTKIKRFSNCKVRSIDFAPKKRITWAAVPADYMETIDCILANGNILANGEEYEVDSDTNFDTSDANCFCMFSQDIRLAKCSCIKTSGCTLPVDECFISVDSVVISECSLSFTVDLQVFFTATNTSASLSLVVTGQVPILILPSDSGITILNVPATGGLVTVTITDTANLSCSGSLAVQLPSCGGGLRMKFCPASIELGYDLAFWNTLFNLPAQGTPFTSLSVIGENVYLNNGGFSNVILNNFLAGNANLLEFDDSLVGYIYDSAVGAFDGCPNLTTLLTLAIATIPANYAANCPNLNIVDIYSAITVGDGAFFLSGTIYGAMAVNMPQVVTIVKDAFSGSGIVIVNCLSCTTVGQYAFAFCSYLVTVNLPVATSIGNNCFNADSALTSVVLVGCTNLGGTVGNNQVFDNIFGSTLTLSASIFLQTCNAGSPDGDITLLSTNSPAATIFYI